MSEPVVHDCFESWQPDLHIGCGGWTTPMEGLRKPPSETPDGIYWAFNPADQREGEPILYTFRDDLVTCSACIRARDRRRAARARPTALVLWAAQCLMCNRWYRPAYMENGTAGAVGDVCSKACGTLREEAMAFDDGDLAQGRYEAGWRPRGRGNPWDDRLAAADESKRLGAAGKWFGQYIELHHMMPPFGVLVACLSAQVDGGKWPTHHPFGVMKQRQAARAAAKRERELSHGMHADLYAHLASPEREERFRRIARHEMGLATKPPKRPPMVMSNIGWIPREMADDLVASLEGSRLQWSDLDDPHEGLSPGVRAFRAGKSTFHVHGRPGQSSTEGIDMRPASLVWLEGRSQGKSVRIPRGEYHATWRPPRKQVDTFLAHVGVGRFQQGLRPWVRTTTTLPSMVVQAMTGRPPAPWLQEWLDRGQAIGPEYTTEEARNRLFAQQLRFVAARRRGPMADEDHGRRRSYSAIAHCMGFTALGWRTPDSFAPTYSVLSRPGRRGIESAILPNPPFRSVKP